MYFRAVQPFCNLSQPGGADARHSLLLSYPAKTPVMVVTRAVINRDFKVAYISFISMLSMFIPVLAGGVFTAQYFQARDQVEMLASMPGYIGLSVLVSIYALSYLVVWPTRKRYLPHNINTIGGLLSWLYASPLLADGTLQNVRTKQDLVERLDGSPSPSRLTGDNLTGQNSEAVRRGRRKPHDTQYAYGIYVGRDGREHLGIDRLQRPGSREMLVALSA
jgi:hypothetical protein